MVCSPKRHGQRGRPALEGFFGKLKRERVHRSSYPTLDAAKADVFGYIERFHNPTMRRTVATQDRKF